MPTHGSRYSLLLKLLKDGDWHSEQELRQVVAYPRQWIRELQLDGKHVDQVKTEGQLKVRLLQPS
jgi:biotin operon repressor